MSGDNGKMVDNVKQRLSNIEFLRLLAMLYVLIVHADFSTFGAPTMEGLAVRPVGVFVQYWFECFAICCVDVFVLISGWFGIRFSLNKLWAFLFQVVFYSLGLFLLAVAVTPHKALTLEGLKSIFLFNGSDYWFIKAYLILMVLAPMLNAFCDYASRREFKTILIVYFAILMVYGWLEPASVHFTMNGCTALSFVGLYLLGRYLKMYRPKLTNYNRRIYAVVYVVACLVMFFMCLLFLSQGVRITLDSRLLNYGCPLVILSAVALLLLFSKWSFCNRVVNNAAKSCLAVYLIHCNYFVFPIYKDMTLKAHQLGGAMVVLFVLAVFVLSIMLDRVRIFSWNKLSNKLFYAE